MSSTFAGVSLKAQTRAPVSAKASKAVVCKAGEPTTRRNLMSFGALSLAFMAASPAKADLTADLLAKTETNKVMNDKKRMLTSGANFARTRTVTDGTCAFPNNLIGCENNAEMGNVRFVSDDLKYECEGIEDGKICPSKPKGSLPSPFGL